jgi:hypothetical protein
MVRGSPSMGDRDQRDGTSRAGTWAGPAHSCPLAPLRKVELYPQPHGRVGSWNAVLKPDLRARRRCDSSAGACLGNLCVESSQPNSFFPVDAFVGAPRPHRYSKDAARGDDVVDKLLCDRHVRMSRYRRIRTINVVEVLDARGTGPRTWRAQNNYLSEVNRPSGPRLRLARYARYSDWATRLDRSCSSR